MVDRQHVDMTTMRQRHDNDTTSAARPAYQLETCWNAGYD